MDLRRVGTILLALAASGCALGSHPGSAHAQASGTLELKRIGSFASPVHIENAPGFRHLLFVVEKAGRIAVLRGGEKLSHPFLDIRERVNHDGERGLLSVAFPPDHRKSRRFYVFHTQNNGDNAVVEFKRSRRHPARAIASSRRRVLVIPHPDASNHNGGQLQFGPDGRLYISTGDGGSDANAAANLGGLQGKLLRIDPRKRRGHRYTVPATNPYLGRPGRNEIYAYGLRNPWRFSFDSARGWIAIGDVGAGSREEINYETRVSAKGANFGWPSWEGDQPHSGDAGPDAATFPIFTYPHPDGCAIVGGYVVHDPGLPTLGGRYLYTDLCHGDIRSFVPHLGGGSDDQSTGLGVSSPTSFGEGARGRIYVASFGGGVFRLRASP